MIINGKKIKPENSAVQLVKWHEQNEMDYGHALYVYVRSRHVSTAITVTAKAGEIAEVNWPGQCAFGNAPRDFADALKYAFRIAEQWDLNRDDPHTEATMRHIREEVS